MSLSVLDFAAILIFSCGCLFLYLTIREESRISQTSEPDGREPMRCPICAYLYAEEKKEQFSSCPRCGTINRKKDE